MSISKYLINDTPLIVLPSLAKAIGLNEAIVLQQVHYWLLQYERTKKMDHFYDDQWWVYNTYEQWQEDNFPFWAVPTIKRIVLSLEEQGLIVSDQPHKKTWDRKKWYTINYDELDKKMGNLSNRMDQLDPIGEVNMIPSERINLIPSIYTETNPESTTETSGPTSFSTAQSSTPQEPSQGENQEATTKDQKETTPPTPPTETPAWVIPANWDKQPYPLLEKRFAKTVPENWTDGHLAIWRYLFGKSSTSAIPKTGVSEWVTVVYADMLAKTHLPALTPALVWDFNQWYFGRDFVKAKLAEGKDYSLPKHDNTDKWQELLSEWLRDRQASPRVALPTMQAPQEVRTVPREVRHVERAGVPL